MPEIGGIYKVDNLLDLDSCLFMESVGDAKQGRWITMCLEDGQYVMTSGLSSCTAFAIWDPLNRVASLAHFDGGQTSADVTSMIDEVLELGGDVDNLQFAAVGSQYNQTLISVWNCLDPRLSPAPRPPAGGEGPANVFFGNWAFLVCNGWLGQPDEGLKS